MTIRFDLWLALAAILYAANLFGWAAWLIYQALK